MIIDVGTLFNITSSQTNEQIVTLQPVVLNYDGIEILEENLEVLVFFNEIKELSKNHDNIWNKMNLDLLNSGYKDTYLFLMTYKRSYIFNLSDLYLYFCLYKLYIHEIEKLSIWNLAAKYLYDKRLKKIREVLDYEFYAMIKGDNLLFDHRLNYILDLLPKLISKEALNEGILHT